MATRSITPTFVRKWLETLHDAELAQVAPDPARTAIFSADMINGFLREGPLSSERVNQLTEPVLALFTAAYDHGVRDFVLSQDTHSEETPEFRSYPPHALKGSSESRTIPEIEALPFVEHMTIVEKNSLNPAIGTRFDAWLEQHPDLQTAIVVGDCTDLCVYQLAMHLRLRANALDLMKFDVIVPANCVETFDIPSADAQGPGIAHPGDFFHEVFLYHMASNGIRVVKSLQ
ncbi:MAG TPA: isochorismatase family cysteine hydrolase [Thermomicrobiales bacterium]|nr:isochorismatase family cysteine hydrolase [Thermomicrobiales bacterium]